MKPSKQKLQKIYQIKKIIGTFKILPKEELSNRTKMVGFSENKNVTISKYQNSSGCFILLCIFCRNINILSLSIVHPSDILLSLGGVPIYNKT